MKVLAPIRRGGFGRVDKVEDDGGRVVARKTFDPEPDVIAGSDIGTLRRRFEREVKVQSAISSAFIMPILESDLSAAVPWFTMPLASQTFDDVIAACRKSGDVPSEALSDVLNALAELHSIGCAHRDLKPANILELNGRWVLSDFGLVLPPSGVASRFTRNFSVWGSAPWCAPEQMADFKHATFPADIYAFGSILHDVVTDGNRVPYHRQTCPGPLGAVIEKCTEVDPRKRFKSIAAVRAALFTALSTSTGAKPSADAASWISKLEDIGNWSEVDIEDFLRFAIRNASPDERTAIFRAIDEEKLVQMGKRNDDLLNMLSLELCKWAQGGFDFTYCDVLVGRLEKIFEIGSYECKARAAIATAELGASHNRWYVMQRLVKMCGSGMDNALGTRIAIEIIAEDAQQNFKRCVDRINYTVSVYHPAIAAVL